MSATKVASQDEVLLKALMLKHNQVLTELSHQSERFHLYPLQIDSRYNFVLFLPSLFLRSHKNILLPINAVPNISFLVLQIHRVIIWMIVLSNIAKFYLVPYSEDRIATNEYDTFLHFLVRLSFSLPTTLPN